MNTQFRRPTQSQSSNSSSLFGLSTIQENPSRTNFSDWYTNNMKRLDHLNKILSDETISVKKTNSQESIFGQKRHRSRSRGDIVIHSEHTINDMPAYELRDYLKKTNAKLKSLFCENELMREAMRQATDYGNLQVMATEIKLLEADRDRLRKSLSKVVGIEGKILEYKREASMSRKYKLEAENLRKELDVLNEKFGKTVTAYKTQNNELILQVKIAQKERNEYRNKAEKLEYHNDLLKFELEKLKFPDNMESIPSQSTRIAPKDNDSNSEQRNN